MAVATGLILVLAEVDTDSLGTFSGEIERVGSPLETAIRKARMGMERSGLPIGLASEGCFGPDPRIPFFNSDREWVVLVDDLLGITVAEHTCSFAVPVARGVFGPDEPSTEWLQQAGFPSHGLIVRAEGTDAVGVVKGIQDHSMLRKAVQHAATRSPAGKAVVESDLRAHLSPSRQVVIAEAADRLARRLARLCPICSCPGWGWIAPLSGLPCGGCGKWVAHAAMGFISGCPACPHTVETREAKSTADPAICPACNP